MDIVVTIPDAQSENVEAAFKAQGFDTPEDALRDHVARVAVNYATSQAAIEAGKAAQAETAAAFGTTPEALAPRSPGAGPRGR